MASKSKCDDVMFVQLDPTILSSYMEKLSLENSQEIPKVPAEISPNDMYPDTKDIPLPLETENVQQLSVNFSKVYDKSVTETSSPIKVCVSKRAAKNSVDKTEKEKDINGNEDSNVENLNNLIDNLELSDSENEEENERLDYRERGADRTCRKSKNREQTTYRRSDYDRSQFNNHRLRFLSGASHVEINASAAPNQILYQDGYSGYMSGNVNAFTGRCNNNNYQNFAQISAHSSAFQNEVSFPVNSLSLSGNFEAFASQSSANNQNETINQIHNASFHKDFSTLFASTSQSPSEFFYPESNFKDAFHDDSSSKAVSSPESGYDTSASPSSSPPLTTFAPSNLDLIPESVDEQEILNFLSEIPTNFPLDDYNFLPVGLEDEDHKKKEIIDFLKDVQVEESEPSLINRETETIKCDELSRLCLESVLVEPNGSIFASDMNEGSVQAELDEFFQVVPNMLEEQSKLNSAVCVVSRDCVQKDLCESTTTASVLNGECSLAELNVLTPVLSAKTINEKVPLMRNLDLRNKSCARTTLSLSHCSQNSSGARIACRPLNDKAKKALRDSLTKEEFHAAQKKMYRKINEDKCNNRPVKVIYVEDAEDKTSENQTNLHRAVLNSDLAEIYCLVEGHKQNADSDSFSDLNLRDKHRKTALDYAIEKNLTLVIDYLKENNVCQSPQI